MTPRMLSWPSIMRRRSCGCHCELRLPKPVEAHSRQADLRSFIACPQPTFQNECERDERRVFRVNAPTQRTGFHPYYLCESAPPRRRGHARAVRVVKVLCGDKELFFGAAGRTDQPRLCTSRGPAPRAGSSSRPDHNSQLGWRLLQTQDWCQPEPAWTCRRTLLRMHLGSHGQGAGGLWAGNSQSSGCDRICSMRERPAWPRVGIPQVSPPRSATLPELSSDQVMIVKAGLGLARARDYNRNL
jgi:hypothetical protein